MRHTALILLAALSLGSCSTTLEPPSVDESTKRPVNQPVDILLQSCRHELHNEKLRRNEAQSLLESLTAAVKRCSSAQGSNRHDTSSVASGNQILLIYFAFDSSHVQLSPDATQALLSAAKTAPLIQVRGRTDGLLDNPSDSRLARVRAEAVRTLLIAAGIEPARIRATYQPTGDPAASNLTAAGRNVNRRVEVEIYRTLPSAATSLNAAG